MRITPRDFNDFTDIDELSSMINKTITVSELEERILKRKSDGYMLLNLEGIKYVISLTETPHEIKEYINVLYREILSKNIEIINYSEKVY